MSDAATTEDAKGVTLSAEDKQTKSAETNGPETAENSVTALKKLGKFLRNVVAAVGARNFLQFASKNKDFDQITHESNVPADQLAELRAEQASVTTLSPADKSAA